MGKKVLFGAKHSIIEPLGLLALSGVAENEGWENKISLIKDNDFSNFDDVVKEFNPEIIGYTIYTGNHLQTFQYFDDLKKKRQDIKIVFGGPHATYFPEESIKHADYVVLSEGFNAFKKILCDEVNPGIIHLTEQSPFPISTSGRKSFYNENPSHGNSPIKSIITTTGCPYSCTYCYNSSTLEDIASSLNSQQLAEMTQVLGPSKRLFPKSSRPVKDIIAEVEGIKKISPQTQMIYFQDDVFGANIAWLKEFSKEYSSVGLPFHAQMRFEYANPKTAQGKERIELIKEAGCTGLTFAIESAEATVRREILNRNMKEDLMFDVLTNLNKLDYNVRTEQMLGLPYGATVTPTKINLDVDLKTLELNVRLKEETGLPTMAWASIFAPYRGTKIGNYCLDHGFYQRKNNDVPDTFFERSVLQFPKKWTGPQLSANNKDFWMSKGDQEIYRDKMQKLRDLFNYFALVPKGHKLAERFLEQKDSSFFGLSTATRRHLYDSVLYNVE